ncbi:hypothetical protein OCU04_006301 [Sclerotinia nivalis]|uniref:Uncharacterized protein n=1 Tax=Sclerotinia nivalis TaxID=352851 RepID=A0A9X0DJ96_9HELO|nr:hypothetical protein OCU04_006301 [Sclerotinia nivalis]
MDLNPASETLDALDKESLQLIELHEKFYDIDANFLRTSYHHRQKLYEVAAKKKSWVDGTVKEVGRDTRTNVNNNGLGVVYSGYAKRLVKTIDYSRREGKAFSLYLTTKDHNLYGAFHGGRTRLNLIQFTYEDIEVTLGIGDDQQNIKEAWEDAMKDEMESLKAQNASMNYNQREQRKEILKKIDVILRHYSKDVKSEVGSHDEVSANNAQSASIASDRIASLEAELSTTQKQLTDAQNHKDTLVLELSTTKNELDSTQSMLTEAETNIQSLTYELEGRNHPNHDIRTLSVNTRLRFFNESTRRNDHAAVHSGDVRADTYMIHENIHNKFDDGHQELFLHTYGVTVDMVNQGRCGRYRIGSKNVEIADLRGTMAHCLSFSEFTNDKNGDIEFESLRDECELSYERFLRELGSAAKAQNAFDFDPNIEKCLTKMRDISQQIVDREKLRLRSH